MQFFARRVLHGSSTHTWGETMFRIATALLLTLVATLAHAEQVVPLTIGGTEVRIAMQDGYLRASEKAPALFATSAAALPPALRLVDAVIAESDLKRMLAGQGMALPYLQVQVVRDAEAIDFSLQDWRTLQPMMAKQMGATDLDAQTQALQSGMGERMGKATGGPVEVKFGEIGKPVVYSQAGDVIRFVMRLPINGTVHGQAVEMVLDCAGAALVLNGKLLVINTYLREDGQADASAEVRAFLDAAVTRAQALNTPAAPITPGKAG
jgi:hypothetical protein